MVTVWERFEDAISRRSSQCTDGFNYKSGFYEGFLQHL